MKTNEKCQNDLNQKNSNIFTKSPSDNIAQSKKKLLIPKIKLPHLKNSALDSMKDDKENQEPDTNTTFKKT